jgi:hypothetical protein
MAASVIFQAADGVTQIIGVFAFPDAIAGKSTAPVKFAFQSTSDRVLNNVTATLVAVGQNDGANQTRIAQDTTTLSVPYGVTATLGAVGSGGLWGTPGTRGFRITALNANGETIGSGEVSVTIDVATKKVTLAWTAVTGATGYNVYDTDTPGTYPASSLRATLAAVTTYDDLGGARSAGAPPAFNSTGGWVTTLVLSAPGAGGVWLSTGVRYYRVAAYDTTGVAIGSSTENSVNVDVVTKNVTVSWVSFPSAAYYQVFRTISSGSYPNPAAVGGTTTGLTLLDSGAATGTGALTIATSYGIPPSIFGTGALLLGNVAINQQMFFWVTRVVPSGTPEAGNPRLANVTVQEN